jgi:hypothetical protein
MDILETSAYELALAKNLGHGGQRGTLVNPLPVSCDSAPASLEVGPLLVEEQASTVSVNGTAKKLWIRRCLAIVRCCGQGLP